MATILTMNVRNASYGRKGASTHTRRAMRVWEGVDKWVRTGVYCSMGERVLHERLAEVNDSFPSQPEA